MLSYTGKMLSGAPEAGMALIGMQLFLAGILIWQQ
jgi:hypothetical protein